MPLRCAAISGTTWGWTFLAWKSASRSHPSAIGDSGIIGFGPTDHIGNLQLLCGSCNRIKGDRGMEYPRAKLRL